eukprot:2841949-Amphidinium_carterae.1
MVTTRCVHSKPHWDAQALQWQLLRQMELGGVVFAAGSNSASYPTTSQTQNAVALTSTLVILKGSLGSV